MGVGDWVRDKVQGAVDSIPGNPAPAVVKALDAGTPPATPAPAEAKTPQQAAYEAKEKYMNRNNPGYVPRAKGGPVKAGGCPMKNVDNSGMTKAPMAGKMCK